MPEPTEPYSLADTWLLNNRVNLMLLDRLTPQQLAYTASPRARNIAGQIAHLHNVRGMWLEVRSPSLAKSLPKLEKGPPKESIRAALEASGKLMGEWIAESEKTGKMKAAKRGVAVFFGYALAHEAHHRGQILLHLKYAGMPVDRDFSYAIWDWQII